MNEELKIRIKKHARTQADALNCFKALLQRAKADDKKVGFYYDSTKEEFGLFYHDK